MNREIKFRGLRSDGKGWVYGYYSPVNVPLLGTLGHCINEEGYRAIDIEINSLGQFTGLKDKNGFEIYEGDIFKGDEPGDAIVVDWNEEKAAFGVNLYGYDSHNGEGGQEVYSSEITLIDVDFMEVSSLIDCEIIGNIHENPELL